MCISPELPLESHASLNLGFIEKTLSILFKSIAYLLYMMSDKLRKDNLSIHSLFVYLFHGNREYLKIYYMLFIKLLSNQGNFT